MPRTPPGRLLSDIARSRNREQLLASVHQHGFSIKEVGLNGVYGQFVPLGTPGSIELARSILVGHHEIARAKRIASSGRVCASLPKVPSFLNRPSVRKPLLGDAKLIADPRGRSRISNREVLRCSIHHAARKETGLITVAEYRSLPTLSSVRTLLAKANAGRCIIVCHVTNRHVAAIVLSRSGDRISVRARSVFEIYKP